MSFLTPLLPRRTRRRSPFPILIHLIQREQKRVIEFPSLMFVRRIPYQSVRRRRIRHWCAAADARGGDRADRRRRSRGRSSARARSPPPSAAARARSSSCSTSRRAWATATTGAARATRRASVVRGLGADDRATLVLFAKNAEENMRATADRDAPRGGDRRREGRLGRDALRPGAEARREHPEPLADQAARGGADQRLPAQRLERLRGSALPRGHDRSARCRSRRRTSPTSPCRRSPSRARRSRARSASR